MGRKKPVPGPLTLTQTQTQTVPGTRNMMNMNLMNGADRRHGHSVKKPTTTIPIQAPSQTQTQHEHRPRLGETSNIDPVRLSPPDHQAPSINSLSPKSPRSPYTSKFSPKNLTKTTNHSQPQIHPQSQSQSPRIPHPSSSPSPSPSSSSSPSSSQQAGSFPRKAIPQPYDNIPRSPAQPHQRPKPTTHDSSSTASTATTTTNHASTSAGSPHEAKQPHIAELQQRFPPLTRATTSSPQQQSQHHHQERRLKSSHGRRPEEKEKSSFSSGSTGKAGFFFNFHKSSKSSDRLPPPPQTQTQPRTQATATQTKGRQTADLARPAMNGTDHPPVPVTKQSSKQSDTSHAPTPSLPTKSETSLADSDPNYNPAPTKKTSKPKPFTLLSRTKSHREKDGRSPRHTPSPQEFKEPVPTPRVPSAMETERPDKGHIIPSHPKTAAAPHDRAYREAMPSSSRAHSADRAPSRDASSDRRGHQDRDHQRQHQGAPRDGNGASSFFNNLRREGGRVAESIGKGLFGKGGRSASTTERDPVDDEHYVIKVINRPLVEQTRLTRISKRLEESRDKTEFWMPAFPWRAIDYLNYKGCDVEGLYRVPGSGPQIKKWQRRFDEQYDVDLFTQEDLYDINIIGSMLKAWLRELPDELFPKEAQDRIARECVGSETVPQMLIDELSSLSPFNYYLLFAITCHLSLLLAHSDKNKMDFRNLCICFQPCMKIDAFCFKFLVCDWRDCWKGCKTEAKYIEEEYKLFDQPPPPGLASSKKKLEPRMDSARSDRRASPGLERDERHRNASAESNGKRSQPVGDQSRLKKKSTSPHENGKENGNAIPKSAHNETLEPQDLSPRGSGDMRPLSPIKPLSPLGF